MSGHISKTTAEIAKLLSENERIILAMACVPLREQSTFPVPRSPDRAALIASGLVTPCGYFVEATELGHQVMKEITRAE